MVSFDKSRKLREGELLGCESESSGDEGSGYGGFRLPDESDEDEEEEEGEDPGEGNPNERILWAAQHNKMEVAKEMLLKNAKLVKVAVLGGQGQRPLHLSLIHISEPTRPY